MLSIELPALDRQAKLKSSREQAKDGRGPLRYAEKVMIEPVSPGDTEAWTILADGRQVWRVRVYAEEATSLEFGFTRYQLPEGAKLTVHGNGGERVRGPYTAADNEAHGQLWVPIVEGDVATAELVLPPGVPRSSVDLVLTHVLQGFYAFWRPKVFEKASEPCNVDVACPQAEPWGNEIRATARIAVDGGICTGTLINNTAYDGRPLFLTAEHCINNSVTELEAGEVVASATVYWNFENPFCRTPGSEASDGRGSGTLDQAQSGAKLLAIWHPTDFGLLELDDTPAPAFSVRYSGWDRRDRIFEGGVSVHHPDAQEKRISFEHDPLDIAPLRSEMRGGIRVLDWDLGITEFGSSGAGLWTPAHRLVGQLSGGDVEGCKAVSHDTYGRIAVSWEGGGTPETRLKDHLDPAGTGAETLGGMDDCDVGAYEVEVRPAEPVPGTRVTLNAAGPVGGMNVAWDLDGDGGADKRGETIRTRFADSGERVIAMQVSPDGESCLVTFEKQVRVRDARVTVAKVGDPTLVCGDSDGVMEPGERWEVPVTLENVGETALDEIQAVFARDGVNRGARDDFGYELRDSQSAACPYGFIWPIRGEPVTFTGSRTGDPNHVSAKDDGYSEPIPIKDFRFYGQPVREVVMSTNGYLSTSPDSDGSDHSNDCPIPARPEFDPNGGRLLPFHGDFVVQDAWTRFYTDCPRLPDTDTGSGACRVFQWNEYRENPFFDGKMPFQVILYPGSDEVVFQYGTSTPDPAVAPTVGIQDAGAADGLLYGCKSAFTSDAPAEPRPESAVCFFAPGNGPSGPDPAAVSLQTPTLNFGNLGPGETATRLVKIRVPDSAVCGTELGVQLHGTRFDGGFSPGPGVILAATVGGEEGVCNANASCAVAKADPIDFTRGMWFNPARDGHGIDVHTAGDTGFLVWYTYEDGHKPVWYQAVGTLRDNQIHGDLLRFSLDPGEPLELASDCSAAHSNPRCEDVGEAMFTALSEDTGLFHWTLDGQPGGERFEVLKASSAAADRHTGHWYPPLEPGWGLTVNQQGSVEFGVLYFYDDAGDPTWALGVQGDTPGLVPLDQFTGFCPSCPWVKASGKRIGDYTRSFSTLTQGAVNVDVDLRPPLKGAWQRKDVEIRMLSEPVD